jgi:hypothetical protein
LSQLKELSKSKRLLLPSFCLDFFPLAPWNHFCLTPNLLDIAAFFGAKHCLNFLQQNHSQQSSFFPVFCAAGGINCDDDKFPLFIYSQVIFSRNLSLDLLPSFRSDLVMSYIFYFAITHNNLNIVQECLKKCVLLPPIQIQHISSSVLELIKKALPFLPLLNKAVLNIYALGGDSQNVQESNNILREIPTSSSASLYLASDTQDLYSIADFNHIFAFSFLAGKLSADGASNELVELLVSLFDFIAMLNYSDFLFKNNVLKANKVLNSALIFPHPHVFLKMAQIKIQQNKLNEDKFFLWNSYQRKDSKSDILLCTLLYVLNDPASHDLLVELKGNHHDSTLIFCSNIIQMRFSFHDNERFQKENEAQEEILTK